MTFLNSERLSERKKGKKIVNKIKEENDKTLIIHYSCESFFNLQGRTPRIVTICVKNRGNNTTKTFSIQIEAQILNKPLGTLTDSDFDVLEKSMLNGFYSYLKKHKTHYWVHWNMRNSSFGFEAISNRYKILGGSPSYLDDRFIFDLPILLGYIYTYKFAKHKPNGQLLKLAAINSITDRDALPGKEEAIAFEKGDYLALHMSTTRKVEIIDRILTLADRGSLKIDVSIFKVCGLTPSGIIEIVRSNWILFLLWSILVAIIAASFEPVIQYFVGTSNYGQN
ncbi:hypothetical protein [Chitinophaga sp. RAB17]|uniref:hypothetical protein n=1 Tax=Chitinophaga sp. RAB17 TaxID=3233049 RepID=UPI003F93AB39